MVSFTPWLSGTITGFVYLCALFFLILPFLKKCDLSFLHKLQSLAPYLAVVVVFFSYAVGLAAHYCFQELQELHNVICNYPENYLAQAQIMEQKIVPPGVLSWKFQAYDTMVLFRYLMLGFVLLAISLGNLFRMNRVSSLRWMWVFTSIMLSIVSVIACVELLDCKSLVIIGLVCLAFIILAVGLYSIFKKGESFKSAGNWLSCMPLSYWLLCLNSLGVSNEIGLLIWNGQLKLHTPSPSHGLLSSKSILT